MGVRKWQGGMATVCALCTPSWAMGDKLSPSGVKETSVPHRAKASSAVWTSGSPNELIIGHLEGFRKI